MADRDFKRRRGGEIASDPGLTALSRALTRPAPARAAGEGGGEEASDPAAEGRAEVELTMADLVSDDNGEIVFFNDSGFRTLGLSTTAAVVASGSSPRHVTAGGADVTGFKFVTFDNGLTLYFESGLDLIVHRERGAG
jgi:hypothetical protein